MPSSPGRRAATVLRIDRRAQERDEDRRGNRVPGAPEVEHNMVGRLSGRERMGGALRVTWHSDRSRRIAGTPIPIHVCPTPPRGGRDAAGESVHGLREDSP